MSKPPSVIPAIVAAAIANPTAECVIPPNRPTRYGYVIFSLPGKRNIRAHRYAYEQAHGPIPPGLEIDHLCHDADVCRLGVTCPHRACVNPAHLAAVTGTVNNLRSGSPSAHHARATRCPHGHPYDRVNTYPRPRRWRGCRACRREACARYQKRRKAA